MRVWHVLAIPCLHFLDFSEHLKSKKEALLCQNIPWLPALILWVPHMTNNNLFNPFPPPFKDPGKEASIFLLFPQCFLPIQISVVLKLH